MAFISSDLYKLRSDETHCNMEYYSDFVFEIHNICDMLDGLDLTRKITKAMLHIVSWFLRELFIEQKLRTKFR